MFWSSQTFSFQHLTCHVSYLPLYSLPWPCQDIWAMVFTSLMWFSICSRPFHSCMPCLSRAGIYTKNNAIWVNSSYCLNFSINYFIKTSLNICSVFLKLGRFFIVNSTTAVLLQQAFPQVRPSGDEHLSSASRCANVLHHILELNTQSVLLKAVNTKLNHQCWCRFLSYCSLWNELTINQMQGICCFQWCELFWIYIRFAETHLCGQVFLI